MSDTTSIDTRLSTSTGYTSTSRPQQPRHWNADWKHFILAPKTVGKDGVPEARRPLVSRPENCGHPAGSRPYQFAQTYWDGVSLSWDEALDFVSGAFHFVSDGPKDYGLPPQLNELVVLDCDVRTRYTATASSGTRRSRFGTVELDRQRGIDDLSALCSSLGHDLSELATYTVRTPSGGLHLYFHQSIETPIEVTSHHRENWLIDVIASENNWVAAPPTPGYTVVCDYPVATMPDWLAEVLVDINQRFLPLGGKRRIEVDDRVRELRRTVMRNERHGFKADGGLLGRWVAAQVDLIRIADESGGWNLTIYQVTKDLARMGWDQDSVETIVLAAARPWSDREERNAIATIRSGFKNLARNSNR